MLISILVSKISFELRFVSATVSYESLPKLSRLFKDNIAYRLLQKVREGKSFRHLVIHTLICLGGGGYPCSVWGQVGGGSPPVLSGREGAASCMGGTPSPGTDV